MSSWVFCQSLRLACVPSACTNDVTNQRIVRRSGLLLNHDDFLSRLLICKYGGTGFYFIGDQKSYAPVHFLKESGKFVQNTRYSP